MITEKGRDCIVLVKGDTIPVTVSDSMVAMNWPGGQGVRWAQSGKIDDLHVTFSDGLAAGFLVWGSDELADRHMAITRQQPYYKYAVLICGGGLVHTASFEQYTYASRVAPPLVPITYSIHDPLYFSLRGLWTNEDEWTVSGDPRAPNVNRVGTVFQTPVMFESRLFLGIQHSI